MRIPAGESFIQVCDQRRAMKVDELPSEDSAHAINIGSVCPVRVVHTGEGNAFFLALESCEHHMG